MDSLFAAQIHQCHPFCGTEGCRGILSAPITVLQEQRWGHSQSTGGKPNCVFNMSAGLASLS